MKSKSAILVALTGWIFLLLYMLSEYMEYGSNAISHTLSPNSYSSLIFHIFVFTVPVVSTIMGYLISERKKLLDKTQQSEKNLIHAAKEWRETFDSMPYGVMLVDSRFNITRANSYMANLVGMPLKELVSGKKCHEVVHKNDFPINGCPLAKSIETRKTETYGYYMEGSDRYFEVLVTPIIEEEGNTPSAYVHLMLDITDIKHSEKLVIQSRDAFFNMLMDIDSAHRDLKELYYELITAFANVIDAKSQWTKGHSVGVAAYAVAIARAMGIKKQDIEILKTGALLHDIGKIGTYDVILDKTDWLTDEEFDLIKVHPIKGEEILMPIKEFAQVLPIIRSHHEKLNGTGYPDGLKGEDIPLCARILAVADSYESMTSKRPYRPAPGKNYAVSELKRCSGTHFDSKVIEVFLRILEKEEKILIG